MSSKSDLRKIYVGVDKSDPNRRENDLYSTPPIATYALTKYDNVPKIVVEPCAGRGHIAKQLERSGRIVYSSDLFEYPNSFIPDIKTGQDALLLKKPADASALVTNPPYHKDLPRKILEKGLAEYDYVALFLRLTFLEGIKRKKIFEANKPTSIIFISDRIAFLPNLDNEPFERHEQIGGMIAYAWFIWDKKATHNNTKLTWVSLSDEYEEWRATVKPPSN